MTPLKFWKRKLPLTLAWILVIAVITVFLSTGISLFYTTGALPRLVDENNKTVALIGEGYVFKEGESGYYGSKSTALTQKHYEELLTMNSVKNVYVNKITGAYSENFYAQLPWEPFGYYLDYADNKPYNDAIVVGEILYADYYSKIERIGVSFDGESEKEYNRRVFRLMIVVEDLYLFNDVFTDGVFHEFKCVELIVPVLYEDETELFKNGERYIFYLENYRDQLNGYGIGPSAMCNTGMHFDGKGIQVIDGGEEFYAFVPDEVTLADGVYASTLKVFSDSSRMPVISPVDGSVEDFLASPENKDWKDLFKMLETVNCCLPVVGTDCLEGQYAFITDRAKIIDGRAFTAEEYANGEKVIVISKAIAEDGKFSVGDVIKISQFDLTRESGRTQDYFDERKDEALFDEAININPSIGSFISAPKFSTTDEEFTIVGIYEQSEEWSETMFSFTPNTVFMPSSAQIDGGYGGVAYSDDMENSDGETKLYRNGAEGIGLVVELKNGMTDEFRQEIANTDMAECFLIFEQGYDEAIIPARLLASMGQRLFIIIFCGWFMVLILYVLLYQLKQNKNLGIMRSVGVTSGKARRYIFSCCLLPVLLGSVLGSVLSVRLIQGIQSKLVGYIMSDGEIGEQMQGLTQLLEYNQADPKIFILAALAQICIFAVVLWICAYAVAKRPPRKLTSK